MSLGVIGPGQIFGEVDVIGRRRHVYTVKSKTPGASVYMCDGSVFTKLLSSIDPERVGNLTTYQIRVDQKWAGKLANVLNSYYRQ